MELTSYSCTCTAKEPRPPQLKFNNLLNKHFSLFFFLKYFVRKNWRGEGESLFKNGTIDGYSNVRRILKRGGGGGRKFGKNKDLNQKLFYSNLVRFFAHNEVKSKKKGLHSNLIQFFAQSKVKSKKSKKKVFTQI